jgi:hypothetical protein
MGLKSRGLEEGEGTVVDFSPNTIGPLLWEARKEKWDEVVERRKRLSVPNTR